MSAAEMLWPGKISSSLAAIRSAALRRQPKPRSDGVVDARVLGDAEVGAERQFLEHAAYAELLRARHRIVVLDAATHGDLAAVGHQRARHHMHQRRLAGAIVADETDAFAGADVEVDAAKRANGAEMFFGAVQSDDVSVRLQACSTISGSAMRTATLAPTLT